MLYEREREPFCEHHSEASRFHLYISFGGICPLDIRIWQSLVGNNKISGISVVDI